MEGDLGLHLWKDSRNRRGNLRESGTPFYRSGTERETRTRVWKTAVGLRYQWVVVPQDV